MTAVAVAPEREIIVGESEDKMSALEQQVRHLAAASRDAIADTRTLKVVPFLPASYDAPLTDRVMIEAPGGLRLAIGEVAHDQFAEKLGIPKPYYQRMLASQPDLLADNMNRWLNVEPEQRLLRMVTPLNEEHGSRLSIMQAQMTLRGFLGKGYRPLDNAELVAAVLPEVRAKGAILSEFNLTETRLHAKFVTVERDVKDIVTEIGAKMGLTFEQARARHVIDQHEIVAMGVSIRNSEIGFASLDVSGTVRILKCLNYYIAEQQTKVRHVGGKRNGNGDDADLKFLSAQTQRLDNAAIFSRVTDTVKALLDENKQYEYAEKIQQAKATIIEPSIPTFEFIGRIGEQLQLTDGEAEVLKEEVVRSNMIEGGFTQFSLAQGVTALARQSTNYDRKVELERAGWQFIEQDATKLLAAGKAAAKKRN